MRPIPKVLLSCLLCLLLGYPFAYYIARKPPEVASRLMRMIRNKDCDDLGYTYVLAPKIYLGRTVGPARTTKI